MLHKIEPVKIGDYEFTGKLRELVPPQLFAEELIDLNKKLRGSHIEHRVKAFMENSSDEAWFKWVGQTWAIEGKVIDVYVARLMGIPSWGLENHEIKYLMIRQLYDESKHAKTWEDVCLRKGWIKSRREIYLHPYFRPLPEWQTYLSWLYSLWGYPIPVMFAGENLVGETNQTEVFKELLVHIDDPILRSTFLIHLFDESYHATMGKLMVEKYATTPELQELCRWAVAMGTYFTTMGQKAIHKFCMGQYP